MNKNYPPQPQPYDAKEIVVSGVKIVEHQTSESMGRALQREHLDGRVFSYAQLVGTSAEQRVDFITANGEVHTYSASIYNDEQRQKLNSDIWGPVVAQKLPEADGDIRVTDEGVIHKQYVTDKEILAESSTRAWQGDIGNEVERGRSGIMQYTESTNGNGIIKAAYVYDNVHMIHYLLDREALDAIVSGLPNVLVQEIK